MSTQLTDTAADVQTNIDSLQAQAAAGQITSITLSDTGTPVLTLTDAQYRADTTALGDITGAYKVKVTNAPVFNALVDLLKTDVIGASVVDSGLMVGSELGLFETIAKAGALNAITVLPGASVANVATSSVLAVTPSAVTADADAIAKITGSFDVQINMPNAGQAVTGLAGHASFVDFTDAVGNYTFAPSSDGSALVIGKGTTSWTVSNIQAMNFLDGFFFVAQTPGDASHVNTGNITELYSAVLAREPDLSGLSFYLNNLSSTPSTGLQTYAEYFLSSPEYKNNTAHNYAQSAAGDTQFINDSYQNLLHRTASASEVSFYETNVLAPAVAALTAGTQAYADAQFQAHALMLVYFSASPEFLSDVQITAANPASAQHWLMLI